MISILYLLSQQEVKKDVGTLSNSLSGVQQSETELSLQFERSGSGVVDNQLLADINLVEVRE